MSVCQTQIRRLTRVVSALAGRPVGVVELAWALKQGAPEGLRATKDSIQDLARLATHKHLIDASARLALRIYGQDSAIASGYWIYAVRSEMEALPPISVKTYQNRALGPWLEVRR